MSSTVATQSASVTPVVTAPVALSRKETVTPCVENEGSGSTMPPLGMNPVAALTL